MTGTFISSTHRNSRTTQITGHNAGGSTEGNADDADTGANQPQIEPTYTVKNGRRKTMLWFWAKILLVTDYSMTMYDIPGTGALFCGTDRQGKMADYHNTNTWDILVQGKPYAINKTDDDMYGKNTAQTSVSTDYEPDKEIYKQSDNAIIMGYLIDFGQGISCKRRMAAYRKSCTMITARATTTHRTAACSA